MISTRLAAPRRFGAAWILSLVLLSGCAIDQPTSQLSDDTSGGRGGSAGPTVNSTVPDSGLRNTTIDVRVLGSGFDNGSQATWAIDGDTAFATTKVKTNSTRFVKSGELVANITIAADAPLELFDVVVVTASGKPGIGIEKFTVKQGLTLYNYTFDQGLQTSASKPFSGSAKTGNPFYGGVSGDPVYLTLPASSGGDPVVCNTGSSLQPSTGAWGAYAGVWKGTFHVGAKGQGPSYHVSFNATHEDGTGWIALVVNGNGVKTNGNLTLTFTNVVGLVSLYSTPTGSFDPRVGPFDSQDRCLTFSITAAP